MDTKKLIEELEKYIEKESARVKEYENHGSFPKGFWQAFDNGMLCVIGQAKLIVKADE